MKRFLLLLPLVVCVNALVGQGVSFSYLIPKNGYLAAPVSPFSVRGIGIGGSVGLETGATLYLTPGLSMEGLPFQSQKPLVGPHYSLMIPGQAYARLPLGESSLKFLIGGFFWGNLGIRLNEGNLDRELRKHEGWDVLNTDAKLDDKIGMGIMGGIELELAIHDQFALIIGTQYLMGSAKTKLTGTYTGGTNGVVQTENLNINNASILLEGLEISLGIQFNN